MLHPDVVLRKSQINGKGLFTVKKIPKGTILWRKKNVRIYSKKQIKKFSQAYKKILKKYAYLDLDGTLVYCTDNARYWNHSCNPNASGIPHNPNMDIALRDIDAGEELTYDYALLLDINDRLKCLCGSKSCRGMIKRERPGSKIIKILEKRAENAMKHSTKVKQPLFGGDEIYGKTAKNI